MASSVDTPMAGFCAPQASPLAVDTPMRTPVNEPGPRATAMASTSASLVSVFFSICSALGREGRNRGSVQLCVRPLHCWLWAMSTPSRHRATDAALAEDSSARISMMSRSLP